MIMTVVHLYDFTILGKNRSISHNNDHEGQTSHAWLDTPIDTHDEMDDVTHLLPRDKFLMTMDNKST
jgi:hypothetical protein